MPSQLEQKRDGQYFSRMFKFSKIRSEWKLKFSASRGSHISFLITSCFTLRTFAVSSQCVLASRTQGLSSRKSSTVGLESRPDAMACCVWRPIPQCSSCPRAKSSPSAVRYVHGFAQMVCGGRPSLGARLAHFLIGGLKLVEPQQRVGCEG